MKGGLWHNLLKGGGLCFSRRGPSTSGSPPSFLPPSGQSQSAPSSEKASRKLGLELCEWKRGRGREGGTSKANGSRPFSPLLTEASSLAPPPPRLPLSPKHRERKRQSFIFPHISLLARRPAFQLRARTWDACLLAVSAEEGAEKRAGRTR